MGRGIALLFHDRGTRRGECSAARPGRTLTPGKARYPFYRRLGLEGRKISSPLRFDPRTVQPVARRYTDWATRPTYLLLLSRLRNKGTIILPPPPPCDFMPCTGTIETFYLSWNIMNNVLFSERVENFTTLPFFVKKQQNRLRQLDDTCFCECVRKVKKSMD